MIIPMTISDGTNSINLMPLSITPGANSLDSSKSGRDNNSGDMFRDMITNKLEYTVKMPADMSNTEVSDILAIILAPQFIAEVPDIKTGSYTNSSKAFYCASCKPEIKQIISRSSWIYNEWSFEMTEM